MCVSSICSKAGTYQVPYKNVCRVNQRLEDMLKKVKNFTLDWLQPFFSLLLSSYIKYLICISKTVSLCLPR